MAISARSYGTVAEVQALVKQYTTAGSFDTASQPTLAQVEKWIDNASATLNVMLSVFGFTVPVTQEDAKAACAQIVVEVVAELCHAANNTGRFFTEKSLAAGRSPLVALRQDLADWVKLMAGGLENMGVPRSNQAVSITCTVSNPQYLRTVVEDNSSATTDWSAVL